MSEPASPPRQVSPRLIAAAIIVASLAIVGFLSPAALRVIICESPCAAAILLAGLGLGAILNRITRLRLPGLLYPLGLGLGALSLLVLALGTAGILHRAAWITLITILDVVGLLVIVRCELKRIMVPRTTTNGDSTTLLWLLLIPFAALALLVSTFPPGTLWPAEGNGYDVLEYHLAAPREFFDTGRILYLPHNIYSNFPFNVEMLYLLAMILRGDAAKACFAAQLVNLALGALAVAAIWKAARPWGHQAAMFAALLAASCPFSSYLCGLAYVENGLLFFTALSLAMLTWNRSDDPRRSLTAGLFAGLACGCKYIAAPQVALPLACALLWQSRVAPARAIRHLALFSLGCLITFSPWLIKNTAYTGNPVFPLARNVFHEKPAIWDDDGAARWHEGHLPAPEDRSIPRRLSRLFTEVIASPLYGATIALGLIAITFMAFHRRYSFSQSPHLSPAICLIAGATLVWLFFTHLVDRFAIVLIPPCCLLTAIALAQFPIRLPIFITTAAVILNLALLARSCSTSGVFQLSAARTSDGLDWFLGPAEKPADLWPSQQHIPRLNEIAVKGEKILMIADARRFYLNRNLDSCVVFNQNPLAEAAASKSSAELLNWLRQQGYSYIFVNWSEMHRLRKSRYGFWKSIDEELFNRLTAAGLKPVENFSINENAPPYATLFQLPASNR